ncbi:MAG: HU family DNA-binding protein [Planctomycetota bacterium]
MNKAELLNEVARDTGSSTAAAERLLNAVLKGIEVGLQKDKIVQLVGFGTFVVKERKARTGRNPATGQEMHIPESKTVSFRVGKALKESIG